MRIKLQDLKESGGWDLAGVSRAAVDPISQERLLSWLQKNKAKDLAYIERRQSERLEPQKYFDQAQTVIVFADYYFSGWAKGSIKVSNYSWDQDYHVRLKEKAQRSVDFLKTLYPQLEARICVDTSPVLEKVLAVQAGLGWQAKNSLVINRKWGSQIFLAEVLCNLPLSSFEQREPETDHCGNCTKCLEACPTQALSPYELHAERCISYWNLEHKGDFEDQTPDFQGWVAGCDICQEVCPWNSKLIPLHDRDTALMDLKAQDFEDLGAWNERIQTKAIAYVKKKNWPRNLSHIVDSSPEDS